ncbi:hypothetical protein GLOIN_2v1783828 [Rhizophagus irregularis DAOM 181602=DAOM 197198]|uniref:C2H2-type domain-containing protein n=1 Tax=Rhizophagus irregularis (strain DAOM 181602 / DAOM 197198 / MUCL 43194) TaxID=747089 RepID=A0A2P4PE19_RHIID|nr:hypothetical protein GLOIN_2v1783828 [Rhizophagus irregularis DAOM 181602=DAOM 197198]POG63620.1 hypothetical protein GLOIN_2v1783828 [Rhizophagus irregularis DAOM 181602=DAOM 197198]|eukprot:XP_025170486.1 hypothetical protein GLOIN_2v1783828 [Rhizophagus irregularis DAOM 181602=DAOM 197198]
MIQSEASNGIVSPPITPTATCDSKFECNVCRKVFKSKSGLTRHHNIVKKYNISRSDLDILPENTTRQFKGILVHYIHKKLPSGYKKLGKQTVSIPATESQFYAVFKDHIHYYSARKNIYKCIFHGVSANQILADILEMQEWGLNFMSNVNVLITKQCKSRYERGQLVVEWKQQKNSDFNGNLTQAGHIYFHFFNSQAMIQ